MGSQQRPTITEMAREVQASRADRAVFTQVYLGPHNPLDALAWAASPGSVGPTGTPDPGVVDDGTLEAALTRAAYSRPAKPSRWRRAVLTASPVAAILLAVTTVGAVAIAATIASRPTTSLSVFARAQTPDEQAIIVDPSMEIVPGTLRLLGGDGNIEFVTFQRVISDAGTDTLHVCLTVRNEPGNVSCVPFDVVAKQGFSGTHRIGSTLYTFAWGPTGDLVLTAG